MKYNLLSVYDVSPIVYTGTIAGETSYNRVRGLPVGGILKLMAMVSMHLNKSGHVVLCFDGGSQRKSEWQDYKRGRDINHEVLAQLELLYDFLPNYGISCLKETGYEADDLVFSVCEKYKREYNEIRVFSADYDLVHNVCDTVEFRAVNSNVNSIDKFNFSTAIYPDKDILYNTISPYKALCGCKSDTISEVKFPELGLSSYQVYELYKKLMLKMKGLGGDDYGKEAVFRSVMKKFYPKLKPETIKKIESNTKLVFPKLYDLNKIKLCNKSSIDLNGLQFFLSLMNDKDSLRNLALSQVNASRGNQLVDEYTRKLTSGVFAADRNLKFKTVSDNSEILNLGSF